MRPNLEIRQVDVDALVPYAHNAKEHTDEQIAQIAASIEEFGFNDPVAIWGTEIVEGHGRVLAAKRLGMDKVPVIRLDHLTDEQRRAYTHVHNQLTMNTGFDEETLAAELAELDFDWDMLGFELPEEEEELEFAEDDGFEENPEPRCKQGDVWVLGRHRLMCGDSTSAEDVTRLMGGVKADITVTSPPYGAADTATLRAHKHAGRDNSADPRSFYNEHEDDADGWADLMRGFFAQAQAFSCTQFINVQMLANNKRDLLRFASDNAAHLVDIMVWNKHTCPPQMQRNVLNNAFEFVFIFDCEGASRALRFGDFKGTYSNYIETNREVNEYAGQHGAVFPVAFPCRIMEINAKANTVYEPFCGTGTTVMAAEQMGRTCYGMELDPKYCDIAINRWEEFTGEKAVLEK